MIRDLISGVISSLLVVLFVEGYLRLRGSYHKRLLRLALGRPKKATVVASVFPHETDVTISLMGTHDAYAIAHILAAYRKVGVEPPVVSVLSLPVGLDTDLVCIGGYAVNKLTKAHLDLFCPTFVAFEAAEGEPFAPTGYRCGPYEFVDDDARAWGFLVKLGPKLTGRVNSTILVWGLGPLGTSAASYFLSDLYRRLPARGRESYFVAIPVQRAIGYRGVSSEIIDISSHAWPTQDADAAINAPKNRVEAPLARRDPDVGGPA